jgi:DNA polymerase-3 subunit delta
MTNNSQKTVYLFHGENSYSSTEKLKFWQVAFVKKYGDESNIETIEGKKLDARQFETNIETMPFLIEKRFIIIKNFFSTAKKEDERLKQMATSIEKTPDFCIIIFHENKSADKRTSLYKKIVKIGKVEEFKAPAPPEIANWIIQKAKKEGIKISMANAHYLSQHAEPELWQISNELEKLKIYANGEEITQEMIDKLIKISLTASIFKFTDAIGQKNTKQSIKTLETLKENGEELGKIFFMLVRHFRILIQVQDMISKGEPEHSITKKLGQHPFVIKKTCQQSRNFTSEGLVKIYQELLEIDKNSKIGIIKSIQGDYSEYQLAIEKLIINCCK